MAAFAAALPFTASAEEYSYKVYCAFDAFDFTTQGDAGTVDAEWVADGNYYTIKLSQQVRVNATVKEAYADYVFNNNYSSTTVDGKDHWVYVKGTGFYILENMCSYPDGSVNVVMYAPYTVEVGADILEFSWNGNNLTGVTYNEGANASAEAVSYEGGVYTVYAPIDYEFTPVIATVKDNSDVESVTTEAEPVVETTGPSVSDGTITLPMGNYAPNTVFEVNLANNITITVTESEREYISSITNNNGFTVNNPTTFAYNLSNGTDLTINPAADCAVTSVTGDGVKVLDENKLNWAYPIQLDLSAVPAGTTITISARYSKGLSGIEAVEADAENGVNEIYNLQGIRVNRSDLPAGIYIVNGKKQVIR